MAYLEKYSGCGSARLALEASLQKDTASSTSTKTAGLDADDEDSIRVAPKSEAKRSNGKRKRDASSDEKTMDQRLLASIPGERKTKKITTDSGESTGVKKRTFKQAATIPAPSSKAVLGTPPEQTISQANALGLPSSPINGIQTSEATPLPLATSSATLEASSQSTVIAGRGDVGGADYIGPDEQYREQKDHKVLGVAPSIPQPATEALSPTNLESSKTLIDMMGVDRFNSDRTPPGADWDSDGSSPLSSPPSSPVIGQHLSTPPGLEQLERLPGIKHCDDETSDKQHGTGYTISTRAFETERHHHNVSHHLVLTETHNAVVLPGQILANRVQASSDVNLEVEYVNEQKSSPDVADRDSAHTYSDPTNPSTPHAPVALQLPSPPYSVNSNAGTANESPSMMNARRHRKPPTRFGEFLDTTPSIEDSDETAAPLPTPDQKTSLSEDSGLNHNKASVRPKRQNPRAKKASTKKAASTRDAGVTKTKAGGKATKPKTSTTSHGWVTLKLTKTQKALDVLTKTVSPSKSSKPITNVGTKPRQPRGNKDRAAVAARITTQADASLSNPPRKIKVDSAKLALSRKLTSREGLQSKPSPIGGPMVWAESRQALCETLPYFKKPQGGCYQNDGHVYGFLFDGVGHCREYLDENTIICRAGGSMEADSGGGMVQKKDQSMKEAQVQAVLNDIAHHNPVIVICGNRNISAPCKMPHQYCVLGWYKPLQVWCEKTGGKGTKVWTTIKYRMERLNRHKPAWHQRKGFEVSDEDRLLAGQLAWKTCEECQNNYPEIYLQGWMCLDSGCAKFWKIKGNDAPYGTEGLDYNPSFLLQESESWKDESQVDEPEPSDLRPSVPDVGNVVGDNLIKVNTRGICCPKCGRCNSRRLFKGWVCENTECDFQFAPKHHSVATTMLHTPWDAAPTLVRNKHAREVHIEVRHCFGYKVSRYTFDGIQGSFTHAAATKQVIQENRHPGRTEGGADLMFQAIQTVDMGLERRTFAAKKMSAGRTEKDIPTPVKVKSTDALVRQEGGESILDTSQSLDDADQADDEPAKKQEFEDGDLMTAFSMNYGMPYKFVASGASQSFEHSPWPVIECRRRLNWAQKVFLDKGKEEYKDFNEELIFAYLEGQKIEYHDDGESGLGPRIATLSLGGRAKMHMRMKLKHFVGCSKMGIFTEEKPVPGGIEGTKMDTKRLDAWEELQKLKDDGPAYTKRRKELPKELGLFNQRMKKADDLVTVTLSHGDIILMEGYDIQKYLEHKVVPEGCFRFALTCRTVLQDHLRPEERPDYEVKEDSMLYPGPQLS